MIDLEHLNRIRLFSSPLGQRIMANFFLGPNYRLFQHVDIRLENIERIPRDETVIFAMNHTDRYNYWPFQYELWRLNYPFTTVWAKGKYYRSKLVGKFLDACNVIPVPSMGYLVEEYYKQSFGRKIGKEEYRIIKDWIDGKIDEAVSLTKLKAETTGLFNRSYIEYLKEYHQTLMEKVAELSTRALKEWGLGLIIFPEGTRSVRLGEGRIGIAQIALYSGKKIYPRGMQQLRQGLHGAPALRQNRRHHLPHRRAALGGRQVEGIPHYGAFQALLARVPAEIPCPVRRCYEDRHGQYQQPARRETPPYREPMTEVHSANCLYIHLPTSSL